MSLLSHMENQITRRVSRLFPSPFGSCRFGNVSDVAGNSIIVSRSPRNVHPIGPVSSTTQIHAFTTKPKSFSMATKSAEKEAMKAVPEPKTLNSGTKTEGGRRSLRATPVPSLNSCKKTRAKQSVIVKNSSSSNSGWFSSEEQEEEKEDEVDGRSDTFFSLSSDSSDSSRRKTSEDRRRRGKSRSSEKGRSQIEVSASSANSSVGFCSETVENNTKARRRNARTSRKTGPGSFELFKGSEVEKRIGRCYSDSGSNIRRRRSGDRSCEGRRRPVVVGGGRSRVEESYAVVKASSDPYRDFRESMVEMIVEKSIYGAEDLQNLLQCFLSLNSSYHHSVILDVFSEICETFFTL